MADTTDLIEKAVADAGLTEDENVGIGGLDDLPEVDPTDDVVDDVNTSAESVDTSVKADTKVEPDADASKPTEVAKVPDGRSDDDKALDKELEGLGLKPPKEGRDNRIPYSRVRKIIGNALKKRGADHTTALSAKDTELSTLREKSSYMDT